MESSLRSEGAKRQALGATLREALEAAEAQRAEQMQMERQQREQLQLNQVGLGVWGWGWGRGWGWGWGVWRESLPLGALDQATKAVEHLCQLTEAQHFSLRAMQASLEPRSGSGNELSGLKS